MTWTFPQATAAQLDGWLCANTCQLLHLQILDEAEATAGHVAKYESWINGAAAPTVFQSPKQLASMAEDIEGICNDLREALPSSAHSMMGSKPILADVVLSDVAGIWAELEQSQDVLPKDAPQLRSVIAAAAEYLEGDLAGLPLTCFQQFHREAKAAGQICHELEEIAPMIAPLTSTAELARNAVSSAGAVFSAAWQTGAPPEAASAVAASKAELRQRAADVAAAVAAAEAEERDKLPSRLLAVWDDALVSCKQAEQEVDLAMRLHDVLEERNVSEAQLLLATPGSEGAQMSWAEQRVATILVSALGTPGCAWMFVLSLAVCISTVLLTAESIV